MHYILVKFEDNYGDEFDTTGFRVFTQEGYVDWLDRVNRQFQYAEKQDAEREAQWTPKYEGDKYFAHWETTGVQFGFGSNEQLHWGQQEYFHSSATTTLITQEQKDFLDKVFGDTETWGWGVFPDFDNDFDLDE